MIVYCASATHHAAFWKDMRQKYVGSVVFSSSWINKVGSVAETPEHAKEFWADNLREISISDAVLAMVCENDNPRGMLVEVGAALALGRRVLFVSEFPWVGGTWQYHPLVTIYGQHGEDSAQVTVDKVLATLP